MPDFIDGGISSQNYRTTVGGKVAVEPTIPPPGSVVADDGFVVVAEHGGVCDFLHARRERRLNVEFFVHGAGDGENAFAGCERLSSRRCYNCVRG